MAESPKFPRLSGNRGQGTPSGVVTNLPEAIQFCSQDVLRIHYRQITYEVTLISSDLKQLGHCGLGYGADTTFHGTYTTFHGTYI